MIALILALQFKSTAASWYNGDSGVKAGVTIILPIYYPVCFYTILFGLLSGILSLIGFSPFTSPLITCLKWIIFRFCCEGLTIFFLHNGIGRRACANALIGGATWALLSGIVPYVIYISTSETYGFKIFAGIFTFNLVLLFSFYVVVRLIPQRLLHHRPALIQFATSNAIISLIFIIDASLILLNFHRRSCPVIALSDICYFVQPFVVLFALRQDTMFWQGKYLTSYQ